MKFLEHNGRLVKLTGIPSTCHGCVFDRESACPMDPDKVNQVACLEHGHWEYVTNLRDHVEYLNQK